MQVIRRMKPLCHFCSLIDTVSAPSLALLAGHVIAKGTPSRVEYLNVQWNEMNPHENNSNIKPHTNEHEQIKEKNSAVETTPR